MRQKWAKSATTIYVRSDLHFIPIYHNKNRFTMEACVIKLKLPCTTPLQKVSTRKS